MGRHWMIDAICNHVTWHSSSLRNPRPSKRYPHVRWVYLVWQPLFGRRGCVRARVGALLFAIMMLCAFSLSAHSGPAQAQTDRPGALLADVPKCILSFSRAENSACIVCVTFRSVSGAKSPLVANQIIRGEPPAVQQLQRARMWVGSLAIIAGALLILLWIVLRRRARAAAETLLQSEGGYRALFENALVGLFQTLPEGGLLRANQAFAAMYGYASADEIVAESYDIGAQLYADPQDWCEIIETLTAEGWLAGREVPMVQRDGTRFWASVAVRRVLDDNGTLLYYEGTHVDITERRQAEDALRESQQQGRRDLDAIQLSDVDVESLGLADIIDVEGIQALMDSFYNVTHIGVGILDMNSNVLVGTGWQDICTKFHRVHPETFRNCVESDTVLSAGVARGAYTIYRCKNNMWDIATPIVIAGKRVGNLFLGQFFFEDETPAYEVFRRQAQRYGFDEQEYLAALEDVPRWSKETIDAVMDFYTRLTGMISDLSHRNLELARLVTQRDHLLRSLRESEEKYRVLVENAGEVIYVAQDGMIRFANAKAAEFMGYTREELTTISFVEFAHPDDRAMVVDRHFQRLKGIDVNVPSEFRVVRRSGEVRWVELHAVLIDWEGRAATLNFVNDITERKHAEEERVRMEAALRQAQKMEAVGRLAGGVAHDFNNMLTVILGYVNVARSKLAPTDALYQDLGEVEKAAQRSADLTQQLLAFSRKQMVVPRLVDLNEVITQQRKLLVRLIGEDIRIDCVQAADLWCVRIDPAQVDQILTNLAVNARDAIGGVGTITIETSNVPSDVHSFQPGDYVKLSFSDTGGGIDADTLEHIFEPFFTTKALGGGTGLGLSIVYGIVEQNNGVIQVNSAPGQGTKFELYFPRFTSEVECANDVPATRSATGTETVLVVEDEPQILHLVRRLLERDGYTVLTAETPDEACAFATQYEGEIDLLLTDVVLPTMNGKDLRDRICVTNPAMKTLFMSGYTADVIAFRGVVDEGVEFIQKPFALELLGAKVRELLDT